MVQVSFQLGLRLIFFSLQRFKCYSIRYTVGRNACHVGRTSEEAEGEYKERSDTFLP